jgi:hypothetical protein
LTNESIFNFQTAALIPDYIATSIFSVTLVPQTFLLKSASSLAISLFKYQDSAKLINCLGMEVNAKYCYFILETSF